MRTKINKSEIIREYLSTHPEAMPSEVVTALATRKSNKVKVTPVLVSFVKRDLKRKAGDVSVETTDGSPVPTPRAKASKLVRRWTHSNGLLTPDDHKLLEGIKQARSFRDAIGGTESAHKALAALDEIED